MTTIKIQEEHISWLDNSFVSTAMKSVDKSHLSKRTRRSALPNGKRKTPKLQCFTQKDSDNNVLGDSLQQEFTGKCKGGVFKNVNEKIALPIFPNEDKNQVTKASQQHRPLCDSHISSAVDDNEEVHLFMKQDQSLTSLVFIGCHFLLINLCYFG